MSTSIQNPEISAELPVEQLYNAAVTGFIQAHQQMAALPQDPKDGPLPALDSMLRDMGVERDNDMSMFVMGGMQQLGMDMLTQSFGMAANSVGAMALDVAVGTMLEARNDNAERESANKPAFKRAATQGKKSVFESRPMFKRAPLAPKKGPVPFATNVLRRLNAAKPTGEQLNKRKNLKEAMAKRRAEIELLDVFKKSGYTHAKRVTMRNDKGELKSMLVPVEGSPKMALTPERKQVPMQNFRPAPLGMSMAA